MQLLLGALLGLTTAADVTNIKPTEWETCKKLECRYERTCGLVLPKSSIHKAVYEATGSWGPRVAYKSGGSQKECIQACESNTECHGWSYNAGKKKCILLDQRHVAYAPADANPWNSGKCFK